jgi:uncharacterized Ntn-hydrolase superfamily protein
VHDAPVTFSLVAHDAATGECGVAVQSHWFSVGAVVAHVRPGIGAVATQSVPVPGGGARILDLLAAGATPDDALAQVLEGDEAVDFRQTAVVDARGAVAVHTGRSCVAHAGHASGDGWSAQANMMASPDVWPAMAEAFTASAGEPLPERMLGALDAAQAAGGDVRGQQSAALVVAPLVDLRVEDHPEPLTELRRLLVLQRAYAAAGDGDELLAEGRVEEAGAAYERAAQLAPDNAELLFWAGLSTYQAGDAQGGLERVRRAIDGNPGLGQLLEHLTEELAPAAPAVRAAL